MSVVRRSECSLGNTLPNGLRVVRVWSRLYPRLVSSTIPFSPLVVGSLPFSAANLREASSPLTADAPNPRKRSYAELDDESGRAAVVVTVQPGDRLTHATCIDGTHVQTDLEIPIDPILLAQSMNLASTIAGAEDEELPDAAEEAVFDRLTDPNSHSQHPTSGLSPIELVAFLSTINVVRLERGNLLTGSMIQGTLQSWAGNSRNPPTPHMKLCKNHMFGCTKTARRAVSHGDPRNFLPSHVVYGAQA